jgi:hypothetical protein
MPHDSIEVIRVKEVYETVDEHTEVISRQTWNVRHARHGREQPWGSQGASRVARNERAPCIFNGEHDCNVCRDDLRKNVARWDTGFGTYGKLRYQYKRHFDRSVLSDFPIRWPILPHFCRHIVWTNFRRVRILHDQVGVHVSDMTYDGLSGASIMIVSHSMFSAGKPVVRRGKPGLPSFLARVGKMQRNSTYTHSQHK